MAMLTCRRNYKRVLYTLADVPVSFRAVLPAANDSQPSSVGKSNAGTFDFRVTSYKERSNFMLI